MSIFQILWQKKAELYFTNGYAFNLSGDKNDWQSFNTVIYSKEGDFIDNEKSYFDGTLSQQMVAYHFGNFNYLIDLRHLLPLGCNNGMLMGSKTYGNRRQRD